MQPSRLVPPLLSLLLLLPLLAVTASGDRLYVQSTAANMREGPSTKRPVVIQLKKGHPLMEVSRQGKWVEVGADRTGGKMGWIHSSLVGKGSPGPAPAVSSPEFERFQETFRQLNAKIKRSTGVTLFTGAEYLGDGIVQVTATDNWLAGARADQESNLRTILKMWTAADSSGLPVAVYVVDQRGRQRMSMKSR